MKDYLNLFVELSLQQCTEADYSDKQKVKWHNAAIKKLRQLETEMIKNDNLASLSLLLDHNDHRVIVNAASFCLRIGILTDQVVTSLERLIRDSDDKTVCFAAKMLMNQVKTGRHDTD